MWSCDLCRVGRQEDCKCDPKDVRIHELEGKVKMLEGANEGWRKASEVADANKRRVEIKCAHPYPKRADYEPGWICEPERGGCGAAGKGDDAMYTRTIFYFDLPGVPDREALAELCHEQWSGWMEYLFSKCSLEGDPQRIPDWALKRWTRQMNAPYSELSEEEKDSDRREADKFIALWGKGQEKVLCG
jgi:hypothetical protein